MIITLNSWVDCLSAHHLLLLIKIYLVPSFGIYSSASLSCLRCYLYFHAYSRSVNTAWPWRRRRIASELCTPLLLPKLEAPPERAACVLLLWQGVWVVQEAWSGPHLVGCQTLSCADCAGCCLVGHGREVPGCGIRRRLGLVLARWWAGSGSQTLKLLPTHWQVKPDPGVSARLLSGRPSS